jgi:tRNA modification GTPase
LSLGGVPIRLTDTAGLRVTDDQVEAIGVERACKLVEAADVLVWLGDPGEAPHHARIVLVHAKADLSERGPAPEGSLPVSSVTYAGLPALLERIEKVARSVLPGDDQLALNRRQAALVDEAQHALASAASAREVVLVAEDLRHARSAFDRLTGRSGVEDLLDALFSRFCLGK